MLFHALICNKTHFRANPILPLHWRSWDGSCLTESSGEQKGHSRSTQEPITATVSSCRQESHSLLSPLSWVTDTSASRWLTHYVANEILNSAIYSLQWILKPYTWKLGKSCFSTQVLVFDYFSATKEIKNYDEIWPLLLSRRGGLRSQNGIFIGSFADFFIYFIFFKQWQNNLKAVHHYNRLKLRAIYSNASNSHATLSITTLLSRGWQRVGRLRTRGLRRVYDHYGSQRGAVMQLVQKKHMLWDLLPVKPVRAGSTSRLWLKWRWLFSVHSVWQRRET